jgi:hypothetical protein
MPLDYLRPEPRKLREVPLGHEAYINFAEIEVDLEGATWVDTEAKVYEDADFSKVKVRPVEGGYVLTLLKREGPPFRFTPRPLHSAGSYAPVNEIIEEQIGNL